MAKRVKIPGRLESAETGNIVTGADAVMDDERGKTQVVVNNELEAAILSLAQNKQNVLTFDNEPTEGSTNPVTSAGVYTADKALSDAIEAILLLIPSAASALNKLVDMQTMNSSIATATASFKGTYNLVSDLHLGVDATHEQIGAALDALSLGADNNDYAFVLVPNSATAPTEISKTERYKFNGTNWLFEYNLNNSGFTSEQWNSINSGVTSLLVDKLSDLPTDAELETLLAGKQDNLTFDNVPTAGSPNPVKSGGVYARNNEIVALINALDAAKQNVLTFDNAPVAGSSNPVKSGGVYTAISAVQAAIVALDAAKQNVLTFDSTPALGSTNPVTSSGIKTELNRIDGNVTTLNDLYEALTQSALVIVQPTDTWPVASPATSTIYRVVDRENTPPQYYSDYMWNGSAMVLMATYDNAIDPHPKKASQNLVTSGGVFDNMGALDVSELNATENPHTLARYVDLSAALAAVPTDYQKGGMSIKFVQSSDNKYVQWRLMAQNFTTDTIQWQGVDEEPVISSKNLVESGGVYKKTKRNESANHIIDFEWQPTNGVFAEDGSFVALSGCKCAKIDISRYVGEYIDVYTWTYGGARNLFFDGNGNIISTFKTIENGTTTKPIAPVTVLVPNNAKELWISTQFLGVPVKLEEVYIAFNNYEEKFKDIDITLNAVNKSFIPISGKVSIIGDSISSYQGTMPEGYLTYYPQQSLGVTSLDDMWWKLLLSLTGAFLEVNASYGGSQVTYQDGYPDFYSRTNILGSPDYIFIALGSNDSKRGVALGDYDYDSTTLSESEFIPAYIKGVKALRTNYPNAKIVLLIFKMGESYSTAIKNIGKHYSIPVIDVQSYYIDNIHPDKKGMTIVAQNIVSSFITEPLKNETANLFYPYKTIEEISKGSAYKKGDIISFEGFVYKFFNDIHPLSLDKKLNKGWYYTYNGKTYKCTKSVQNYSRQDINNGDIVFTDDTLKKYNGTTFVNVAYSDLNGYIMESSLKQVIIDNALPYYPNKKIHKEIAIDVTSGETIGNIMYYKINLPLNTKITTRLLYSGNTWQLTAKNPGGTFDSIFGGRIYVNKEYFNYIEDYYTEIGIYLSSNGETPVSEKATLVLDIDACPFTQNIAQPIIFDTDWGGDVDDSIAIPVLGWGQRNGSIQVLGAALSRYRASAAGNAVIGLDAELQYYGLGELPITTVPESVYGSAYAGTGYNDVCAEFPHTLNAVPEETPTQMYRRILANLPKDVKVNLVVVGTSYNVAQLINSAADARPYVITDLISALDGEELSNTKIERIYYMAGGYPDNEFGSLNVNVAVNYAAGELEHHNIYGSIKKGFTLRFRAINNGASVPYFKIYYVKNGTNHEIPSNMYLTFGTWYEYTFTEDAESIGIFTNNGQGENAGSVNVNLCSPNRRAEANMSMNGGATAVAATATAASLELITKFGGDLVFLGFTTNCSCGDNLYGTNRTWDILYQCLDDFTGGDENKWNPADVTEWGGGIPFAWDPLTVLLAIQGEGACAFGKARGLNVLDAVQYINGVLNTNFGFNDFEVGENGNHYYVWRKYMTTSLKHNRYNQMINAIIVNENWTTHKKHNLKILTRK